MVATAYAGGDGTEASPYEIATGDQFAYFAEQIGQGVDTDAHYVLTYDIDLTARSWEPIGWTYDDYSAGRYFCGTFDGQGHSITYRISEIDRVSDYTAVGLFGFAEGELANLTVNGSISSFTSTSGAWIGGLCGLFAGNVENCVSDVDITMASGTTNATFFGGLTGEMQGGTMRDSLYSGKIDLSITTAMGDLYVGGLSGTLHAGSIVSCKNEGSVRFAAPNYKLGYAGGITGMVYTGGYPVVSEVHDCYNTGKVSSTGYAGGVAGSVSAILSYEGEGVSGVYGCFSTARAEGKTSSGAIAAYVYANSNVGDAGSASAEVENCYYLTGADPHATQAASTEEIYEQLSASAEPGTWILDANGMPRLDWEFVKNATPQASFAATGEDAGTLSGLAAGMRYSVDGGDTWTEADGESAELTGVTPEHGVMVYLPGDLLATLDSDVQAISVTKAAVPEGVSGVACATTAQNDGSLAGVDETMEYRAAGTDKWTAVGKDGVSGLPAGSYDVRVAASGTVLASEPVTVSVAEHVCAPDGGWHSDATSHWHLCSCGERLGVAAHSFTWVTDKEASATEDGLRHEECSVCGYAKAGVAIPATGGSSAGSANGQLPATGDVTGAAWAPLALAAASLLAGSRVAAQRRK